METFISWFRDAERVLITAGAGLSVDAGNDYLDEDAFRERFPAMASLGFRAPYEFIGKRDWSPELKWGYSASFATVVRDLPLAPVYSDLLSVLRVLDKDYFVVTSNVDNYFLKHGFALERFYSPQGQLDYMQCLDPIGCGREVWPAAPVVDQLYANVDFSTQELKDVSLVPTCPRCGGDVFFNVNGGRWYVDDKFQEGRKAYESWIEDSRSMEGRLLVVEIGCGFGTPSVIRYPNERLVRGHSQSNFVRVNPRDYLFPEDIAERSLGLRVTSSEMVELLRRSFLRSDDENEQD